MAQGSVQVTHGGPSRWRRRTGEYASLAAALEAAADGDVLSVAPGTYRENLVVARAITLRGADGARGSVRIAPPEGVALTVRASAVLLDLQVEGQDAAVPALLVDDGAPELTGLRVVTRSSVGIEVRGGARPTVRHCTVDNAAGVGIGVLDGAGGVFEECEVIAAGQSGVAVHGGGGPRLEHCRVHHARGAGLSVTGEGSTLEAVGCEVYEIRGAGVRMAERAAGRLSDCRVHRVTADGVTLDTEAVLALDDCDIHDLPENAVDLRARSVLTMARSTVRRFGRNGLSVWDPGTRAEAAQCEIQDSTGDYPAVWVSDGATAVLASCRVHDVPDALFVLDRGSCAEVTDSDLARIRGTAVSVSGGATARLDDCRIREATTGAWFRDHGSGGTLTGCSIDTTATGVIVTKGADPTFEHCSVSSPLEAGFYVSAEGRGTFHRCRVTGSGGYGFHVIDGCRATLTLCHTERCTRGGYEFADGGVHTEGGGPGPVSEGCTSDEPLTARADLTAVERARPRPAAVPPAPAAPPPAAPAP
ncbi:right-handed parallel beta-helix repeat-containing protein, partial [Streptomyces sp. I05A-00742]|uniref:right-handed parallel beta-helix repeat-containing protein n=1 Tax=Streptomyces sp. I05A-00742 TaxID=2732853 RepID=UPI002017EDB8